jgi:LysM repeat protein
MFRARPGILALLALGLMLGGCWREYGGTSPQPASTSRVIHVVASSDETIRGIARMYGVEIKTIIAANDLRLSELFPGQQLIIPGGRIMAPPAPPAAPEAVKPPPSSDADWYIPRSAWAVLPIASERATPMGGKPNRITVHHTSMPGDTTAETKAFLRLVDERHHGVIGSGGEKGACIGYHYLIARDGRVYEGRPLRYQGAHARGDNNKLNIGVCLLGDFQDRQVPAVMKASLVEVLDRLRRDHGISRSQVVGHKDFNPPGHYHTDCPGRFLYQVVQAYRQGGGEVSRSSSSMTAVPPAP